ncbi:MAG: class I mannose-6-phosphate isomerase [Bacteroidales bacterium]|nr:class I mannose-6-phosphate isomerase [Bacteroidales bacterium]
MLYPIKFYPIYKSKVWGGDKIRAIKDDNDIPEKCGESWEISGVQGDVSLVKNGFLKDNTLEEIIEVYMGDIVGDKIFEKFAYEFPILLKIIEANENLSIQVHPDDKTAEQKHHARGKSEAWYILEAENNAKLISGLNTNSNFAEISDLIKTKKLETILNQPQTKASEVYYIPAGRIHSLGKGNLIVEIQQTSDVTYRLYDYGRTDRELHLDLASDVIDYKKTKTLTENYSRNPDTSNKILKNSNFTINYLPVMNSLAKDYYNIDSFIIYYCLQGELIIKYNNKTETLQTGETVLIPAALKNIVLIPKTYTETLEIYLEL